MPSLLDVDLSTARDDERLRTMFGVTKTEVLKRNPECAACPDFGECGAVCWATAYGATGDLFGRDPLACALWKSPYRRRFEEIAAATV